MSEDDKRLSRYSSVDTFGEDLVRAAQTKRRRRLPHLRRRFLVPVAALGIAIGGGAVAAAISGDGDGPFGDPPDAVLTAVLSFDRSSLVDPGDTITLGFIDQASGDPLRCPDGDPVTSVIEVRAYAGQYLVGGAQRVDPDSGTSRPLTPQEPLPVLPRIGEPQCAGSTPPDEHHEVLEEGDLEAFEVR